jgi:DNA-binding transcriptional LysR family regulator
MPSLKLLEAFYWVARLKGFHAAADRLRVTQPSVSYRVKELEAQLGRPLLLRDGRSFKLTAHGQALFGHAERIIAAAQDLQQQFRPNGLSTGPMRLGVTDAFAAVCLPHLLRRMITEHPSLDITVMVDHSHRLTHAVDQGDLDVAVVSTPPQLPGLRYELLGQQHVGWIGGSAGAGQPAEDLAWISSARIFVTPPPSNLETITTAWFQSVGVAIPRLSVCNSMSAIVGLIEAQTGIGILPFPMVAACIAAGKMRHLELPGNFPVQGIFATYSRGILDIGVGDTLRAIRTIVGEQAFCDASDASQ